MCYRFTILCLLSAIVAPSFLESAPAPRQIYPQVYALVYVGKGKNDRANAKKIAWAAATIEKRARAVWDDPEVRKFAIAKEKKRQELSEWVKKNIRVGTLEGTSVLRVWLMEGTPEEQALIINAALRPYLQHIEAERRMLRDRLDKEKRNATVAGVLQQMEKKFQEDEEEINSFPRLLEWAAVKSH